MSGDLTVLDAAVPADAATWVDLWRASRNQIPFAHPGIAGPLSSGMGSLVAATMTWQGAAVLYPLVLREIGDGRRDIVSPYGYGGPLFHGDAPVEEFASRFWGFFEEWARDERVVSEFTRLSLFDDVLPHPGRTRERNLNFVREIEPDHDALWAACSPKIRQNARRAGRAGVKVRVVEDASLVHEFHRIYTGTMERRNSDSWYRFDEAFFSALHDEVPDGVLYVAAEVDGQVVSIDLMLLGRDTAYYFLGGTDLSVSRDRPNDLVKMSVMEWLSEHGYRWYVLGGGVSAGDSLERYKRGFAPQGERMFRTAERILDESAYQELVERRRGAAVRTGRTWDEGSAFFPLYRAPFGASTVPLSSSSTIA